MKRKFASFLSIGLVIGLLAACSGTPAPGSDPAASDEGAAGTPQQKITINYWHAMGSGVNGETVKLHVQQFNEKYADKIEVIETYQGAYAESTPKIMQAIAAKTQPEVVMMDTPRMPQFIDADACEDLRQYFTQEKLDDSDFVEGLMTYVKQGDKLYGLPLNRSTPILYYNKEIFKEVGLDPNKGPETWEDLKAYAAKLTKKQGAETVRYGIAFGFDFHWYLSAWVAQQGSRMLDEDGKKMVCVEDGTLLNALNFWNDLNKSGVYRKPASANPESVMLNAFYQGEIGMIIQTTGSLGNIFKNTEGKFEFGTSFLPKNKQYGVATGGGSIFITKQSGKAQKDAAWEFVKFLTSTEIAADWSVRTGYLPTRKSSVETEAIKKLWAEKPQYRTAYEQLQYAKDTFRSVQQTEVHNAGQKILQAFILEEKMTPEQAVKEISDMAENLLNQ